MQCIPRHLSMLWDDVREILACLNYLGEVMSRIQIWSWSPEWRVYYTGRGDVINLLGKTFHYMSSWHDSVDLCIWCLYVHLNSQELSIKHKYVGPNESVWGWHSD